MKTIIKLLLGVLGLSLTGMAVLYLLAIWQITPIPFLTAWKVVATVAALIVITVLCYVCAKTFFSKSNNGDKSRGNRAHPTE